MGLASITDDMTRQQGVDGGKTSKEELCDLASHFKFCLARALPKRKKDDCVSAPNLEQVSQIVRHWTPNKNVLSLVVRWSRRMKNHCDTDSVAAVCSMATQCQTTPREFLQKHKEVTFFPKTKGNKRGAFGWDHKFVTTHEAMENEHGVSGSWVTLRFCSSMIFKMEGVAGKSRMRDGTDGNTPRKVRADGHDFLGIDLSQFHKPASLVNRMNKLMKLRWLAMEMTRALFPSYHTAQPDKAFGKSFQMTSEASSSHIFVDFLVGMCLNSQ